MNKTGIPMFDDINRMFSDMKMNMPQVGAMDLEGLMMTQRKNMEALAEANKLLMEGYQTVTRRQAELFRMAVEEAATLGKEMGGAGSPDQKLAKQTEVMKAAMERAFSAMTEIAEMSARANRECVDVINKRTMASFDELKTSIDKTAAK